MDMTFRLKHEVARILLTKPGAAIAAWQDSDALTSPFQIGISGDRAVTVNDPESKTDVGLAVAVWLFTSISLFGPDRYFFLSTTTREPAHAVLLRVFAVFTSLERLLDEWHVLALIDADHPALTPAERSLLVLRAAAERTGGCP